MPERILLVDDHPLTRSALAALLTQHGFEVAGEASDGEEAFECAGRIHPDLILLDLSMPGLDGLSALPRLRGRRADRLRDRGEPARRDPGRRRRLPAEE